MAWLRMPRPARAGSADTFVDISSNNARFDPRAYASAGHVLVMIKSTEATGYINPEHAGWTNGAHQNRLAVAHYHFCRPEHGQPIAEARHFWDTVRPHFRRGLDRLVLDLETGEQGHWPAYLRAIDDELHRYSTLEAILYTMRSAIDGRLRPRSGKFHVAAWGSSWPAGAFRRLPGGTLWAWQYTDGAIDPAGGPRQFAGVGISDASVLNPYTVRDIRRHLNAQGRK